MWSSDPDRAVWEHQGMDGGRGGGGKGWCAATCQAWEPLCVYHRETVPTQNNERALPLLNKKGISAFFSPLKVMELEIGSAHKSLQSVGSLVWPSAVPKLRSLSTDQSQAKHIFYRLCLCVCLEGRRACVYVLIWTRRVCMCEFQCVCTKQKALCGVYGAAVKGVTCRHFLISNWSERNDILLS